MREKFLREAEEAQRKRDDIHPNECLLPPEFIQLVRAEGVSIQDRPFFGSSHAIYPSGYIVILPEKSGGNRGFEIEGHYTESDGSDAITYMPGIAVWGDGTTWKTQVHMYAPGPGPGDFHHEHSSLEEVFDDIMSYFFDPSNEDFQEIIAASRKIH